MKILVTGSEPAVAATPPGGAAGAAGAAALGVGKVSLLISSSSVGANIELIKFISEFWMSSDHLVAGARRQYSLTEVRTFLLTEVRTFLAESFLSGAKVMEKESLP